MTHASMTHGDHDTTLTPVRDSHEKERAQAEKTKYWSIIGSIIGTCIGIVGTTIINRCQGHIRQVT